MTMSQPSQKKFGKLEMCYNWGGRKNNYSGLIIKQSMIFSELRETFHLDGVKGARTETYESVCMETSALYWHALQILHLHEPNHVLPFANIASSFRVFRFTTMCFIGCILINNIYRLQWVLIIGFLLSENKHCWGVISKGERSSN